MSTTSVRAIMTALAVLPVVAAAALPGSSGVEIVRKDADQRIDISIDGQPFTSYLWPASVKKPVLFPIRSAKGTIVTRGVPLEPRPGERMDHPHHVGLWFNFGDVNGIDFWGNSDAIPEKDRGKEGTIVQRAIVSATGGAKEGEITADSDWVLPDESVLLTDRTVYRFSGTSTSRTIDLDITLTAQGTRAVFNDTKEGMLGLRVARSLEAPSKEPEIFTDAAGHPTTVPKLDNTGVTGSYLTAQGKTGDAAWGTRGKWCLLAGTINDEPVTIAILDHPGNPGYPTFWHARGYGLFAANPFGQKTFTEGKMAPLNFTIEPHQSARFRYRIMIDSTKAGAPEIEGAWTTWTAATR